jgi:hypothetical protein
VAYPQGRTEETAGEESRAGGADMSASMIWKGRLGVPYQGSKNAIARDIISILPRGKRFVDLFAGGCAMTHAAMISGKYERFLANDLHGFGLRLFQDAIEGKCNGKWKEWVSREEFLEKRNTDPLISLCWSFGNNGVDYLYGRDKESFKHELHVSHVNGVEISGEACKSLRDVESLERIHGLARLHGLAQVQGLETSFLSYSDYQHEDGDIVYCDPPYACVRGYRFMKRAKITFDNAAFWEWVNAQPFPIFVSEYSAPSGFNAIWSKGKIGLFNKTKDGEYHKRTESVYVADRYADRFQTDLFNNV